MKDRVKESVTYLLEVLEAIDYKGFDADASEHLVVVYHDWLHSWETLNLGQQDERI